MFLYITSALLLLSVYSWSIENGSVPSAFQAFPLQTISIDRSKTLYVKTGMMQAFSSNVEMSTTMQFSMCAIARKYLGGEDLVVNSFTANSSKKQGWVSLEESFVGQTVQHVILPGEVLIMKKKALMAFDENVDLSVGLSGIHGYLSSIGFVIVQAKTRDQNPGRVFFASEKGVVKKLQISSEETGALVDNKQIIAYTGSLTPFTKAPGNFFSWGYGKEGFVTQFSGYGDLYVGTCVDFIEKESTK
ncbi:MAG: AIM24 family protein [Rhabdochlamydiaceae bacterium]|nr:AIM24 family protein [Rhabdochlamydiaceae bacterium]